MSNVYETLEALPEGTRVRVTFEGFRDADGDVVYGFDTYTAHAVYSAHDLVQYFTRGRLEDMGATVEVVEPEWQDGDVVMDADGDILRARTLFDERVWFLFGREDHVYNEAPARPLTLLVRDGKRV